MVKQLGFFPSIKNLSLINLAAINLKLFFIQVFMKSAGTILEDSFLLLSGTNGMPPLCCDTWAFHIETKGTSTPLQIYFLVTI